MRARTAHLRQSRILLRREEWGRRNDLHLTALTMKTSRMRKLEPQQQTDNKTTAIVGRAVEVDEQMAPEQEVATVSQNPNWDLAVHKGLCAVTVEMRTTQLTNVGSCTLSSIRLQLGRRMPTW